MTREEFSKLVGGALVHVTLEANLPGIRKHGLLRPEAMLAQAGLQGAHNTLRKTDVSFSLGGESVQLNHQRPLIAGRNHADEFLEGHSLESWGRQLDQRVFFWPGRKNNSFHSSLADRGDVVALACKAEAFFDYFYNHIDVAPINTGSATRKPAPRGDWIYSPVNGTLDQFRTKRVSRGLVQANDSAVEVSLRADIKPRQLGIFKLLRPKS